MTILYKLKDFYSRVCGTPAYSGQYSTTSVKTEDNFLNVNSTIFDLNGLNTKIFLNLCFNIELYPYFLKALHNTFPYRMERSSILDSLTHSILFYCAFYYVCLSKTAQFIISNNVTLNIPSFIFNIIMKISLPVVSTQSATKAEIKGLTVGGDVTFIKLLRLALAFLKSNPSTTDPNTFFLPPLLADCPGWNAYSGSYYMIALNHIESVILDLINTINISSNTDPNSEFRECLEIVSTFRLKVSNPEGFQNYEGVITFKHTEHLGIYRFVNVDGVDRTKYLFNPKTALNLKQPIGIMFISVLHIFQGAYSSKLSPFTLITPGPLDNYVVIIKSGTLLSSFEYLFSFDKLEVRQARPLNKVQQQFGPAKRPVLAPRKPLLQAGPPNQPNDGVQPNRSFSSFTSQSNGSTKYEIVHDLGPIEVTVSGNNPRFKNNYMFYTSSLFT